MNGVLHMKKLVLKYLPVPIALVLALACILTLSHFKRNNSEYAIISYASRAISLDITVAENGNTIKTVPSNLESNEAVKSFDLNGKQISDVLLELSATAEDNETVFVGAYVHEDTETDPEGLKVILEKACASLTVSYLGAYGTYSNYDNQRAISYNRTIGKMAYSSRYADTVTEELHQYMDSYLIYDSDPYEMAFYAKYMCEKNGVENAEELFSSDFSHINADVKHITKEEARAIADDFLKKSVSEDITDIYEADIRFDEGDLGYSFNFRYNGENRMVFVDVVDGSAREYYADDY